MRTPTIERISTLLDSHGAEPCEDGRLLLKRVVSLNSPASSLSTGHPAHWHCFVRWETSSSICMVLMITKACFRAISRPTCSIALRERKVFARNSQNAEGRLLRLTEEKNSILRDEQSTLREVDLLTHQVGEIEAARLQVGEEETLLARQKVGTNARRIASSAPNWQTNTDSEDSLIAKLERLSRSVRELVRLDPGATNDRTSLSSLLRRRERASRARCKAIRLPFEDNPIDLPEIEARLDTIQSLKRKYGAPLRRCSALASRPAAS